jgi:methanogenic corrinoid protein MtbC1
MVTSAAGDGDVPSVPRSELSPVFTATSVAARLGVAVETLRTWDRRYGIGPTGPGGRGAGGRRRYREADVGRLLAMRRLVAGGTPTEEAARRALTGSIPAETGGAGEPGTRALAGDGRSSVAAGRGLLKAAVALDVEAVRHTLAGEVAAAGVQRCWDDLIVPALTELGSRWEATGEGIDVEHLLSHVASSVLRSVITADSQHARSQVQPPIILAAVDGEQHVLALDALSALLAEQGYPTLVLGASTPPAALSQAVSRIHPAGVFLWARVHRPAVASAAAILNGWQKSQVRRPMLVAVGGAGWDQVQVPTAVQRPATLGDAAACITDFQIPRDLVIDSRLTGY